MTLSHTLSAPRMHQQGSDESTALIFSIFEASRGNPHGNLHVNIFGHVSAQIRKCFSWATRRPVLTCDSMTVSFLGDASPKKFAIAFCSLAEWWSGLNAETAETLIGILDYEAVC